MNHRSTHRRGGAATACAALLVLAAACDRTPAEPGPDKPQPASRPAPTAGARDAHPGKPARKPTRAAALQWDKPEGWKEVSHSSSMRLATYQVPRAEGDPEDGEMSVIPAGGSLDDNINRWQAQFDLASDKAPTRTKKTVNGLEVTIVEMHGTFKGSGMPGMPKGEPKEGWALLGAIAPSGEGQHTFFKLTGPDKTIEAARADFDVLAGSIRGK